MNKREKMLLIELKKIDAEIKEAIDLYMEKMTVDEKFIFTNLINAKIFVTYQFAVIETTEKT